MKYIKNLLRIDKSSNNFPQNLFFSLLTLIIYGAIFKYLFEYKNFSIGINIIFINTLWKYVIIFFIANMVYLLLNKDGKLKNILHFKNNEFFPPKDYLLILFPYLPIVGYIFINIDVLLVKDIFIIIIWFLCLFSLLIYIIPIIFSKLVSPRLLMVLGLAFSYTLSSMASLSNNNSWYETGNFNIQIIFFLVVYIIIFFLHRNKSSNLLHVIVVILFISNLVTPLIWPINKLGKRIISLNSIPLYMMSITETYSLSSSPNVYLFIYDAYVANETLNQYGIDNILQEQFLQNNNFVIYPKVYSLDSNSVGTMSRVLNASTEFFGDVRRGVSGDGVVQNIFQELDYETYGIFSNDYMFRGVGAHYDYSFPESNNMESNLLIDSILIGEFKFDAGFDSFPRQEYLIAKHNFIENLPENPFFIYSHSNFPGHSQNSGICKEDEVALFEERLIVANNEMTLEINSIIANDPTAIIIVAGDHGPYLTKNCTSLGSDISKSEVSRLDIQDRFGTFLAIKWPDQSFKEYDDITVIQDIFPSIFAYLFEDTAFLETKPSPISLNSSKISGVYIDDGIIIGGINDGEPLFLFDN